MCFDSVVNASRPRLLHGLSAARWCIVSGSRQYKSKRHRVSGVQSYPCSSVRVCIDSVVHGIVSKSVAWVKCGSVVCCVWITSVKVKASSLDAAYVY